MAARRRTPSTVRARPARVGRVDGEQHERVDVGVGVARQVRRATTWPKRLWPTQASGSDGKRARAKRDQRRHVAARRDRRSPSRRLRRRAGRSCRGRADRRRRRRCRAAASAETRPRPRGRSSVRRSTIIAWLTTATATGGGVDDESPLQDPAIGAGDREQLPCELRRGRVESLRASLAGSVRSRSADSTRDCSRVAAARA